MAQLEEHHRQRDQLLLASLAQPRSVAELLPILFPREPDGHQILFAMGEGIAHMNHLLRRGAVARVPGQVLRFVRRGAAAAL